ncbi:NnrU family protein [Telmatospirillum sp.]|uniref:NnrU family protein n=1 Tax=Telmatospirillum sp. TaxID=2079197 RepID=UPI00284D8160|nr:NnrU family protein [Telmatospirillum sp.]MDR3438703.1 NnrU family protein [Telmatospirillum sp.]
MDTPDLIPLILAAAAFVGSHLGVSSTRLRPWLIARLGRGAYLGLYSALSVACLVWLIFAYADTPFLPLWPETRAARWLTVGLMPVALILLVGGLRPDNPTLLIHRADSIVEPPHGILAVTRHPMMWGIGLTAILHLLAAGDLSSLIMFGSVSGLALGGTILQDARKRQEDPALWTRLAAQTSHLPFLAILQGRAHVTGRALAVPVIGGLVLYGLMLAAHQSLFGISPF